MTAASSSAPSAPPLLETRQLTRILPATVPVVLTKDATLRIEDGEMVAITGPSGSGKSSLLYLLGALDAPSSGEVLIRGAPLSEMDDEAKARLRLEQIGFVFQFHFLLPEFSVRENVEIPMRKIARLDRETISARATTILSRLGLGDHTEKQPSQLSGGQRQRVAVARALANDPPLILADEPTGSLDSASSEQVFEILKEIVLQDGRTVVAVTHDLEMADRMSRRIHLVDGVIVRDERNEAFTA